MKAVRRVLAIWRRWWADARDFAERIDRFHEMREQVERIDRQLRHAEERSS